MTEVAAYRHCGAPEIRRTIQGVVHRWTTHRPGCWFMEVLKEEAIRARDRITTR